MSISNRIRSGVSVLEETNARLDRELSEYLLILMFLVAGLYMFDRASEFAEAARQFPELTSGVVIVGSLLLLFKNFLPGPIRRFVEESESALGPSTEEELTEMTEAEMEKKDKESVDEDAEAVEAADTESVQDAEDVEDAEEEQPATVHREAMVPADILMIITPIFMLGYIVLSFLIGMLWASPIFVALYLVITGQRWYVNLLMTLLAFIVPYGFMIILNFDLHTGMLIPEGLGILEALGLL